MNDATGPSSALGGAYDVALLDLDGVVYIGGAAIPGAPEALQKAKRSGMRLAYVTNNASRTPAAVAALLSGMNVPAEPADVVTSAHAAARLLADKLPRGARVLVIGAMALRLAVRERGLVPVSTAADQPLAVVQGYGPGIGYPTLAEGGLAVRAGALFVGTNADSTLPGPRGIQPGNGSLLQVIITATGTQPVVAGKPEPPLHAEAVERTGARHPLVVGDRLDTDIAGAVRAGADSMLVLTGVSSARDAVLAPPGQRPTYLAADLAGLLEPQPVIGPPGGNGAAEAGLAAGEAAPHGPVPAVFLCGGWQARRPGGAGPFELTGSGAWIDGLRALCAAAWSAGRLTADVAAPAIDALGQPG